MEAEKRLIRLDDLMKFPIRIDHYDKVNGNEHFVLGIETVLEYAENLATVDAVEVVHGRWVIVDFAGNMRCSVCGQIMDADYNYCPNFGQLSALLGGKSTDRGNRTVIQSLKRRLRPPLFCVR